MSIDGHEQHQIDYSDPNGAIQIKNQPRNPLVALGCRLIKKGRALSWTDPTPPTNTPPPESIPTHQFENGRTPGRGASSGRRRVELEGATLTCCGSDAEAFFLLQGKMLRSALRWARAGGGRT